MRGKHALFGFVARNSLARFVRKVFARKKLLSGKFWGFAPLPCAIKIKGHWPITSVCVLKTSDSKSFNYLERHFWYTSALTSLYAVTPGLTLLRKKRSSSQSQTLSIRFLDQVLGSLSSPLKDVFCHTKFLPPVLTHPTTFSHSPTGCHRLQITWLLGNR